MKKLGTAIFGGGCFWCTEAIFQMLKGVDSVVSGYAGGAVESPSYQSVANGNTGHAEVIKIEFDPKVITYDHLLEIFFVDNSSFKAITSSKDKLFNIISNSSLDLLSFLSLLLML